MTRRKRKTEPGETGEDLPEDTREMWTVAGPSGPDGPGGGGSSGDAEIPGGADEDRIENETGESDEFGEPPDQAGVDWTEGENPEDGFYEDEADWTEDDPVDDDEEPYDEEPYDEDPETADDAWIEEEQPEPAGSPGTERRRSVRDRLEAIPWPDTPDPDPRHLLAGVAVVAVALAVGFGAYQLGRDSGPDLDTARIQGEAAGRQAGAIEGASTGYPAGYRKGREKGFGRAYRRAYRIYYRRAFEQAGLDVPGEGEIEVPEP
ncbi:MAG: hypothetical protein M9938_01320 [Solirubrobacterales bacterium]|nr:hypothetical protein [Solirubrobacterales bacterium]